MRGSWRLWQVRRWWEARARLRHAVRQVRRFPSGRPRAAHGLDAPLIVTLTSHAPRFGTLAPTLKGLLDQDVAPDRTILWIGDDDMAALPGDVLALAERGLEIRACRDQRSFTKLLPALAAFPEAWLVTADDDIYYPPDWLGALAKEARKGEQAVIARRAHLAFLGPDGRARPYRRWELATSHLRAPEPDTRLFPTGVGGVCYPPGAFSEEVFDEALFRRLCPAADDIWFYWMTRRRGMAQVRTAPPFELVTWPGSQDTGLYLSNLIGDRNDAQIRAMEDHFGPMP